MAKVALVEAPPPPVEGSAKAKGGRTKLIVIVAALLLALAGGGFGAWKYFGTKADEHVADKVVAEAAPLFLPVDQFTVNLSAEGGEQFLQTAFSLRVTDQEVVDALKARAPDLRNQVLMLLSSKKAPELATLEGKQKLSAEIMAIANETMLPAFPAQKKAAEAKAAADAKATAEAKAAADTKAAADASAAAAKSADASSTEPKADAVIAAKPAAAVAPAPGKSKPAAAPAAGVPEHAVTGVMFTHFIIQ